MKIFATMKQLGKRKDFLTARAFELPEKPATLRELLIMLVEIMVREYQLKPVGQPTFRFFSESELRETAETGGKIGFGVRYHENNVDESKAVATAIDAFSDGIFRVFHGDIEQETLDAPLTLNDGDTFTFIRLVMLAGRMW